MPRVNDIIIEAGEIAYSNFSGNPNKNFDGSNKRTVTFVIPPEIKDNLINDGWNVREQVFNNDPDREPRYLLEATICYRTRDGKPKDPGIFIVRSDRLVHVTEDIVDTLDGADILNVDVVLGPSYWEQGGRKGIRPYVNRMLVTVKENAIEKKYRELVEQMNEHVLPTDDSELPFPIE